MMERSPINTDGGLLCKGHPMGPTGVSQVAEVVKQLRGEASNQIPIRPKVGLTHSSGAGNDQYAGAQELKHLAIGGTDARFTV